MLSLEYSAQFKRDYKKAIKRGLRKERLCEVLGRLREGRELPFACHDHCLEDSRDYKDMRECHITPDWLLVYQIDKPANTLNLVRTGTHSDLFRRKGG